MEKNKILDIENDGLNMVVEGHYLYIRCNRSMYKYDLNKMKFTEQNNIFKKDGKARGFTIFNDLVFLWDFLDIYILNKKNLEVISVLRLGENLSSDVCGVMWFDTPKAYVKIRNGWVYVLDIDTKHFDKVQLSDTSFWCNCITRNHLFAGTVNGELLEVNKATLKLTRKMQLCKKNIYGIIFKDGLLYTVSQDQTIKVVDAVSLETVKTAKKAVVGMVDIVRIHNDTLIVAGERNPLSFWDKKTLELRNSFDFPFNRNSILNNNSLFVSDRQSVYICKNLD